MRPTALSATPAPALGATEVVAAHVIRPKTAVVARSRWDIRARRATGGVTLWLEASSGNRPPLRPETVTERSPVGDAARRPFGRRFAGGAREGRVDDGGADLGWLLARHRVGDPGHVDLERRRAACAAVEAASRSPGWSPAGRGRPRVTVSRAGTRVRPCTLDGPRCRLAGSSPLPPEAP